MEGRSDAWSPCSIERWQAMAKNTALSALLPVPAGPTLSTMVPTIAGHTMGIATRQTLLGMGPSVRPSLLHLHLRHIALTAPPHAILAVLLAPPRGTIPQWFPSSRQEEDSRTDK